MPGRPTSLFVNEVDADLLCPECKCVLVNPSDAPCGHTFCLDCITKALQTSESCPECAKKLVLADVKPTNFKLKGILGRLPTYCDRKVSVSESGGCEWNGKWEQLPHHLEYECLYTLMVCRFSNHGCSAKTVRKDMATHLEQDKGVHLELLSARLESIEKTMKVEVQTLQKRIVELEKVSKLGYYVRTIKVEKTPTRLPFYFGSTKWELDAGKSGANYIFGIFSQNPGKLRVDICVRCCGEEYKNSSASLGFKRGWNVKAEPNVENFDALMQKVGWKVPFEVIVELDIFDFVPE